MSAAVTARPEDVGLSSERLARIGTWMRGWVDSGRLPGLLTMVMRRGEVVWLDTCGMADIARGRPVAEATLYRFYSLTKPLTSAPIMML